MSMHPNDMVVITGAGISVDSGIKPFRGKDGIWKENPLEMATFKKFMTEPEVFLAWYYQRFIICRNAEPNKVHHLIAEKGFRVITQNVDNLHLNAKHPSHRLVEIHGNITQKRKIQATDRSELEFADWESVDEENLTSSLFEKFHIGAGGAIDMEESYRPHILLFDEYYSDLYEYHKALQWVDEANTILFMGTSNSVGITEGILNMAVNAGKRVVVVDPNPSTSFMQHGVEVNRMTAREYCDSEL